MQTFVVVLKRYVDGQLQSFTQGFASRFANAEEAGKAVLAQQAGAELVSVSPMTREDAAAVGLADGQIWPM